MKRFSLILMLFLSFFLVGCGGQSSPLTKAEMAEKYGMTMDEMDEMSEAAARMNMPLEEHMKMMEE